MGKFECLVKLVLLAMKLHLIWSSELEHPTVRLNPIKLELFVLAV